MAARRIDEPAQDSAADRAGLKTKESRISQATPNCRPIRFKPRSRRTGRSGTEYRGRAEDRSARRREDCQGARHRRACSKPATSWIRACEACHLEYWYPGDREAVLKQQNSTVTYDPPRKK